MYEVTETASNKTYKFRTDEELCFFVTNIYARQEDVPSVSLLGTAQSVHYIEEFCDGYEILMVWDNKMPLPPMLLNQGL